MSAINAPTQVFLPVQYNVGQSNATIHSYQSQENSLLDDEGNLRLNTEDPEALFRLFNDIPEDDSVQRQKIFE